MTLEVTCESAPFAVTRAWIVDGRVQLLFSRAPDPATLGPEHFALAWNGAPVPVVAVESGRLGEVSLVPGPEVQFVGRGVPYLLRLDAAIHAADGSPLADPETEFVLRVEGRGAALVFPYPNPVRAAEKVTFGETNEATRVDIFDLEGERVRSLGQSLGGGIEWDLRNGAGEQVVPGTYIYTARDATATRTGRLVVLR